MADHNPPAAGAATKVPVDGKRNILITSALPYVNNVPHLGNIIGCVLSADVFARYCRMRGYNCIYVCGTDEYGTATETKAMEENCSPKEICDKYHAIHKEVYEWFNISFDEFGRTSSFKQTEICHAIFKKLLENNWLSENTMQQLFCDKCQRFLADRFVEGNCPTPGCNYDSARGDQCEKCGKLLNPTELLDPRCKVCQNTPHIRDTNHLFLELPLLKDKLEDYINSMSVAGGWSQNAIQATHAWLREGLKARCITRDLKWGVPVPLEKFKDKVFYVWFDAPIGYVSITSCYTTEWEKWWKNPENVELYQFMGKDNVPFHTVMFPSTLLGTGENWTLMKTISVTEYLNYEAGKFSKSKGVGVFGNDAKYTNIPVEVWRYYLLANRPEVSDTLFTWTDLQAKLNSELLGNLGNFINRVLSFIAKEPGSGYGSIIPDAQGAESHSSTKALGEKVGSYVELYIEAMEQVKLKQGLKMAMSISSEGNAYLQESQFWKLYKGDRASCSVIMKTSVGLVYLLACLLEPFMPSFYRGVLAQLNLPLDLQVSLSDGDVERAKRPWEILPAGHKIGNPAPLFKEMKREEVGLFREKFAGSQADRIAKAEAEANKTADKLEETKISGAS
ncbi:probable methionine--tRNA ligase [Olea europaea var. sylvestris]|uniref:probable methionine--tRNA ligase n=1 Tax=Olea europaea var. sylvestris TaxID=158386 RepID=UPI000C1D5CDD|nr:probable methionine--tRNA ligase [Olea europaea var. sylvestris]